MGQLGIGNTVNNWSLPYAIGFFMDKSIKLITCRSNTSFALAGNGEVYSWGQPLKTGNNITIPMLVKEVATEKVTALGVGTYHRIALTEKGKLLMWGGVTVSINYNDPFAVGNFKQQKVDLICGERHCMVLTESGSLYSWGSNGVGELGLGNKTPRFALSPRDEEKPQLVKFFQGKRIKQLVATSSSTLALVKVL